MCNFTAGGCREYHSSAANEDGYDILWYRSGTLDQRTCLWFSSSCHGLSREPHIPILQGCRNLDSSWFYVFIYSIAFRTSFERFSPIFRTQGMDDYWKPLVRASDSWTSLYLTIIPGITLWWTPWTLYRICFCRHGNIQFPTDPIKDPFLV